MIAPNGTAAFEFLQLAAQLNPCYMFNYTQFSFGRFITTICCVQQNKTTNFYWFIYLNGKLSPVGADLLKPKNGDTLKFEYQLWNSGIKNHTTPTNNTADTTLTPSSTLTPISRIAPTGTPRNSTTTGDGHQVFAASLNVFIAMATGILVWKY